MNDKLKAFEDAAYRLAKAQAKKRVIERSLNGIIEEQKRRAQEKASTLKDKGSEPPSKDN